MTRRCHVNLALALLAPFFFAAQIASADSIPGLFNTGVDDSGSLLLNGSSDTHFILVGPPPSTQCPLCSSNAVARPTDGAWISPPDGSKWIGPIDNNDAPGGVVYQYTITFDLTALDPDSAMITGIWSSDNGSFIRLNGIDIGLTNGDAGSRAFEFMTPLLIDSGFRSGTNALTFVVGNNGGGPTSLLVSDLTGSAAPIPEPSTVSLLLAGPLLLARLRARRCR
jgi:hypothetical protein